MVVVDRDHDGHRVAAFEAELRFNVQSLDEREIERVWKQKNRFVLLSESHASGANRPKNLEVRARVLGQAQGWKNEAFGLTIHYLIQKEELLSYPK